MGTVPWKPRWVIPPLSAFSQVLFFAMLGGGSWLFARVFLGVFFLGGGFPEHVPGKIGLELEKEESDGKKTK